MPIHWVKYVDRFIQSSYSLLLLYYFDHNPKVGIPHFAFMHSQPYQIFKCLCIIVFYCCSYFWRLPIFTLVLCHNYMKYAHSSLSCFLSRKVFYFGDLYKFSSMPLMYGGVVIAYYFLSKYIHLLVVADIGWVVVPLEDVLYTSHLLFVYV